MDPEAYRKIIFTMVFIILIAISFLIIRPFLIAVLAGIILSYVFYPLYRRIYRKTANKNASSLIASVLVVIILALPLFFVLNTVSKEAYTAYLMSKQKMTGEQLLAPCEPADKPVCRAAAYFTGKANDPQIRYYISTVINNAATKITKSVSNILFSVPILVLDMFIALFVMFFLFRDGEIFVDKVQRIMPLKDEYRKNVLKKINDMAYAVIYGSIIIAIIQGALGGLGFFIFGLPSPLLWGMVMFFAALIPYVGSSIIWFPAALMIIINGYSNLETALIIKGILLMLYGIFIVSTIDNILKPKIIGEKGGLHPVLVMLGVVGGLKFLGFIGVIVGPIILAMLVAFIKIYEEEKT